MGEAVLTKVGLELGGEGLKRAISGYLKPQIVRPLKEKLSVRLAASVQVDDLPEKDVSDAIEATEKQFSFENGKFTFGVKSLKTGSCETAIEISTFGSFDDFDQDSFEQFVNYTMNVESTTPFDGTIVNDVERTITSISVFLYPTNLSVLTDIQKAYRVLQEITDSLTSRVANHGAKKFIFFLMDADRIPYLLRATTAVLPNAVEPFTDSGGSHGVKVINPSDLELKKILDQLTSEFAGLGRRLEKKVESRIRKDET